jgi:hypothetical protein
MSQSLMKSPQQSHAPGLVTAVRVTEQKVQLAKIGYELAILFLPLEGPRSNSFLNWLQGKRDSADALRAYNFARRADYDRNNDRAAEVQLF